MTDATPKQRYDARMKLKRDAQQPDWKGDELITAEYSFDLAERFIAAIENVADAIRKPTS